MKNDFAEGPIQSPQPNDTVNVSRATRSVLAESTIDSASKLADRCENPAISLKHQDTIYQDGPSFELIVEEQLDSSRQPPIDGDAYWRKKLSAFTNPDQSELSVNTPTEQRRRLNKMLHTDLSKDLLGFCTQESVSISTFIVSCVNILLLRWTGDDVSIVYISDTNLLDSKSAEPINPFNVVIPVDTKLNVMQTFRTILRLTVNSCAAASRYGYLAYKEARESSGLDIRSTKCPVHRVVVLDSNEGNDQGRMFSDAAKPDAELVQSKMDEGLTICVDVSTVVSLSFYYGETVSSEWTLEFIEQLILLVSHVLRSPDANVGHYSLLTLRSKCVLPDLTQPIPQTSIPSPPVLSRFLEQVTVNGQGKAVVHGGGSLTYFALDQQSSQIYNWLAANCHTSDPVGIYAKRTHALVATLLGVWKANKKFVILDSKHPQERLRAQLKAVRPQLVLNCSADLESTDKLLDVVHLEQIVRIEDVLDVEAASSELHSELSHQSVVFETDDSGYVSFTSGSTGEPQAILGSAWPVSHFIEWYVKTLDVTPQDRFSMLSGISHDPLLRDIMIPISLGATTCIPSSQFVGDDLGDWLLEQRVTVTHITPSLFSTLHDYKLQLKHLRYICFGGEPLTPKHFALCNKIAPNALVVNFYGATETPQAVGYYPMVRGFGPKVDLKTLPIGKGIDEVQLILMRGNTLCGLGEVGEICVRSVHLCTGYLNNQELTQERFTTNPYSDLPNDRMYRSGDLGRYALNGDLSWIGRSDKQIKIRGFRVEPSEVAHAFKLYDGIADVSVITTTDKNGNTGLRAYVVLNTDVFNKSELMRHLDRHLPSEMRPASIVPVRSLPLTPNGKIDEKLLAIDKHNIPEIVAALSKYERTLAEIFSDVLEQSIQDIDEDIFDLGCHSLLLLRVSNRIRAVLHLEIPISVFFEHPTIRKLGAQLQSWLAETE